MKTAFTILPERTGNEPLHLLLELGNYGISFLWFTKDPAVVKGIAVYNFSENSLPQSMADKIEDVLKANTIFSEMNATVTICYDLKESLLVPETYYQHETAEAMLNLVHATEVDCNYKTEPVKDKPVYNLYAVHKKTEAVLSAHFPTATVHHATSLQLEKLNPNGSVIHCIFFHNSIKVFLFRDSALQLVQQFSYTIPVDAAYHLLNCCRQYDVNPSEVTLLLSGMIDEQSKLYTELYRYFLNIEFDSTDEGIGLDDNIRSYPAHFFSHLTGFISCVS